MPPTYTEWLRFPLISPYNFYNIYHQHVKDKIYIASICPTFEGNQV